MQCSGGERGSGADRKETKRVLVSTVANQKGRIVSTTRPFHPYFALNGLVFPQEHSVSFQSFVFPQFGQIHFFRPSDDEFDCSHVGLEFALVPLFTLNGLAFPQEHSVAFLSFAFPQSGQIQPLLFPDGEFVCNHFSISFELLSFGTYTLLAMYPSVPNRQNETVAEGTPIAIGIKE